MGDPIAPPATIAVCDFAEFHFLQGLGADERGVVLGIRYVDDELNKVTYPTRDATARNNAMSCLQHIRTNVYPNELILERGCKEDDMVPVEFPDTVISRSHPDDLNLVIRWKNKNEDCYCPPRFVRFRPSFDCSDPAALRAGVLSSRCLKKKLDQRSPI